MYFTGDGVKRDHDGFLRILGRVDDVINVSGHRMGTAEVENAINEHSNVIESAVVGYPHEIKGQGIYAFAICDSLDKSAEVLEDEIKQLVRKIIGPIALFFLGIKIHMILQFMPPLWDLQESSMSINFILINSKTEPFQAKRWVV